MLLRDSAKAVDHLECCASLSVHVQHIRLQTLDRRETCSAPFAYDVRFV